MSKPDMSVEIAGIKMRNPVMTASGTFGYGEEFSSYVDLEQIGAMITKGLSLSHAPVIPLPASSRPPAACSMPLACRMWESMPLSTAKIPFLRTVNTPVIVNLFGNTLEEYGELASRLDRCRGGGSGGKHFLPECQTGRNRFWHRS